MTTDEYAREQRLRKQAEIQSLYNNLVNLREREASYIRFSTTIPELVENQLSEVRQKIQVTERELAALGDATFDTPGRNLYHEAFAAEVEGNFEEAQKLYKSAARHDHSDANAALRSLRYKMKAKKSGASSAWPPASRTGLWVGGTAVLVILFISVGIATRNLTSPSSPAAAVDSTPTPTATEVIIIPSTATPTPTNTPTSTSTATPTQTPKPTVTEIPVTDTPTPAPTLRPPLKIVGPKDGLVWKDGAVVFEFENAFLADNELYCLNSMRGYDKINTENWSHPPIGREYPSIPVEASVFRIAKIQGIECITWSASIGVDSCEPENIVSEDTPVRVLGLPRVCNIK